MKNELIVRSLGHAALTFLYISLVGWFMSHADETLGTVPEVVAAMTMLTLFVVSAAVTGSLVVGRPILLYIEGKKAEAFQFFAGTIGWLLVILVSLMLIIF